MATATQLNERLARTPAAVETAAGCFREDVAQLLEPGGLTRHNLAAVSAWLDFPVWDLLDANEAVLRGWARGEIQ